MKPTQKQIELIKFIAGIVKSWASTNDISSPTHYSDIDEEVAVNIDTDNSGKSDISQGLHLIFRAIKNSDGREDKKT